MTSEHPVAGARSSIGLDLERQRLEHRARRVSYTIAALRRLADARASSGSVPAPMQQAIAGFSHELGRVERRLADLGTRPPTATAADVRRTRFTYQGGP